MPQVIIKEVSANYDTDKEVLVEAEKILEVFYDASGDTVFLNVNVGKDDHYITLIMDRKQFVEAVGEALVSPDGI